MNYLKYFIFFLFFNLKSARWESFDKKPLNSYSLDFFKSLFIEKNMLKLEFVFDKISRFVNPKLYSPEKILIRHSKSKDIEVLLFNVVKIDDDLKKVLFIFRDKEGELILVSPQSAEKD